MQKISQIVWFNFEIVIGSSYFYNSLQKAWLIEAGMGTLPSRRKGRATIAPRTDKLIAAKQIATSNTLNVFDLNLINC